MKAPPPPVLWNLPVPGGLDYSVLISAVLSLHSVNPQQNLSGTNVYA